MIMLMCGYYSLFHCHLKRYLTKWNRGEHVPKHIHFGSPFLFSRILYLYALTPLKTKPDSDLCVHKISSLFKHTTNFL